MVLGRKFYATFNSPLPREKATQEKEQFTLGGSTLSTRDTWQHSRYTSRAQHALRSYLYPTNALVADQITRLRGAASRASIEKKPLFYFGQYTGQTTGGTWRPVPYAMKLMQKLMMLKNGGFEGYRRAWRRSRR